MNINKAFAESITHLIDSNSNSSDFLPVCDEDSQDAFITLCTANRLYSNLPSIVLADILIAQKKESSFDFFNYISTDSNQNIYSYRFDSDFFSQINNKLCKIECDKQNCATISKFCLEPYDIIPLYQISDYRSSVNQHICVQYDTNLAKCNYFSLFETVNNAKNNYSYLFQIHQINANRTDNHVLEIQRDLSLVKNTSLSERYLELGPHKVKTLIISYTYDVLNERVLPLLSISYSSIMIITLFFIFSLGFGFLQKYFKQDY